MAKKTKKRGFPNKTLIIIALLVAGGYWLYNQAMKVIIAGGYFRIHKVNLTSIELRVFLQMINQGNVTVDVQNFIGQIFYGQTALGVVTLAFQGSIPPLGQKELEFKAVLSTTTIGMELYSILKTPNPQFDAGAFTIRGTLKAEGLSIPINEKLISA